MQPTENEAALIAIAIRLELGRVEAKASEIERSSMHRNDKIDAYEELRLHQWRELVKKFG
jgi:hypothetical protein